MALAAKLAKAKKLGITFEKDYEPTEDELDKLIEAKQEIAGQEKDEARIARANAKKAEDHARKNKVILQDVDGDDVDQSDYFFPRETDEVIKDPAGKDQLIKATDQTAPLYFNSVCGYRVEREDLIEAFLQVFPRAKGFLFYKSYDKEVYMIIVPLKYATTISRSNESRPGDFQRHALSFIGEGSVNVDSLKLKLARVAKHTSISTEPIAR